MLLRKLRDYSARLSEKDTTPSMYLNTPIRWLIDLTADGEFVNFIPLSGGRRRNDRGIPHPAPHVGRTSAVTAKLLADTGEYVLGVSREDGRPEWAVQCHAAFVALVCACAERTGEPSVCAVRRFLETLAPATLSLPTGFDARDVLTFRVNDTWPIDLPAVRRYWATAVGGADSTEDASARMECVVCGELRPPVSNIPFKIKRIPGGQTSGMAMVSTNAVAFESYGLDDISCAPICFDCGERFSKAANALIAGADTHITVGPMVYIFWTREESDFQPGRWFSTPEAEQIKALYEAARKADPTQVEKRDPNMFYATAFSASGARVVVRDWLETTIPEAQRNLARYFALQELVNRDGGESDPIKLFALAASTVRDATKNLPAEVPTELLRFALHGGELPNWLLFQAVNRNRAAQEVTRSRAALIKMVLLSKEEPTFPLTKEHRMVEHTPDDPILNEPRKRQAYYCGCLLAVLERTQKIALGKTNSTIVGRYFGTASSAPASVFGRLMRMNQNHLEKIRKTKPPGVYAALHKRIQDITHPNLPKFPRTLTLEEQGLFSLGYYHQHAKDRAEAVARKQANEAKKKTK